MTSKRKNNLRTLSAAFMAVLALPTMVPVPAFAAPACGRITDEGFIRAYPELRATYNLLAAQPLSGKAIAEALARPENKIKICPVEKIEGYNGASGGFEPWARKITVTDTNNSPLFAHESFHALQMLNGGLGYLSGRIILTRDDYKKAVYITEAAAYAHGMVLHKEAAKNNPKIWEEFIQAGYGYYMEDKFDATYAKALQDGHTEAQALQTAGQNVAHALIKGESPMFNQFVGFVYDFNRQTATFAPESAAGTSAYDAQKLDLFRRIGKVSDQVNLTPPQFLVPVAPQSIPSPRLKPA